MSTADILGIGGIVVALIGVAVAAFYGRRALNPPNRLIQWHSEATPLMAQPDAQFRGAVEVRVLGQRVNDPYLGRLVVENAGRHDIDSSSFDQERPIRFQVYHARKTGTFLDLDNNPPGLRVDGNSIFIGPELLKSKSKWTVSFVSDGRPHIELEDSHLVNVKIRRKVATSESTASESSTKSASYEGNRSTIYAALIAAVGAIVAALSTVLFTVK